MGWVIFGVIIWIIASNHSARGCMSRRKHRKHSKPRKIENRSRSASEAYRQRTEREDMDRRLQIAERQIADHDEYLRRQFRNL